MAEEQQAVETGQKKKSILPKILIMIFIVLILFISAGTYILITKSKNSEGDKKETKKTEQVTEIGPLVSIGSEVIVNLASSEFSSDHYLKTNVVLEVDSEKTSAELAKRIPQIRDIVIVILSTKTKEKIEEKEGKEALRREIIKMINATLAKGKIRNVYFQDFVIQ